MKSSDKDISRTHRFGLHFQLESILESLTAVASENAKITDVTLDIIRKLRSDILKLVSGPVVESIPEIKNDSTIVDIIVMVSLLRGTSRSFLSEDEIKSIGSRAASFVGGVAKAKETIGL